jgi:hypothetical protein
MQSASNMVSPQKQSAASATAAAIQQQQQYQHVQQQQTANGAHGTNVYYAAINQAQAQLNAQVQAQQQAVAAATIAQQQQQQQQYTMMSQVNTKGFILIGSIDCSIRCSMQLNKLFLNKCITRRPVAKLFIKRLVKVMFLHKLRQRQARMQPVHHRRCILLRLHCIMLLINSKRHILKHN